MKLITHLFILLGLFTFIQCGSLHKKSDFNVSQNKNEISFTFLQFNDFYDIAPLENGTIGGAAKMATIRKKLLAEDPQLYTVLAGDFISPSLLGTLKWNGESIKGKQIIQVFNKIGIDLVTFGNHEFDFDAKTLKARINESNFDWVSSNVKLKEDNKLIPFYKMVNGQKINIPEYKILTFKNAQGKEVRVGIVAPCIDSNKPDYILINKFASIAPAYYDLKQNKVDIILALSHLSKEEDTQLAKQYPDIKLIMGGHEHDHMNIELPTCRITKADANARTAYAHRFKYNTKTKQVQIESELIALDASVALDGEVDQIVQEWKGIENKVMRDMGFDPEQLLMTLPTPIDVKETSTRNKPTYFGQMIARAMLRAAPKSECAFFNSGSIRMDDMIEKQLSQYDILRALPYGGGIVELDMPGSLLSKVLEAGWNNKSKGGFLQWGNIERTPKYIWLVNGKEIELKRMYHVAVNDFLLTGNESGLEFFSAKNPDVQNINRAKPDDLSDIKRDIRLLIIDYIKKGGR